MKAMVLYEYGKPLRMEEVAIPIPGPREVLVKVEACGLCGTDIKISSGILPGTRIPLIMGHEPAGTVAALGNDVADLKVGDRVCVHFYVTCGNCNYCRSGNETLCPKLVGQLGFHLNGGFAEYLVAPMENCIPIPDNIPFAQAAILGDSVATAYHSVVRKAGIKPGDELLVMGTGGVGLQVIQMAKIAGARVVAVDIDEYKLTLAQELGADEIVLFNEREYLVETKKRSSSGGFHAVIDTVGQPQTLDLNLKLLRRGGILVIVGYKPGHTFAVDPLYLLNNEIEVCGSRASSKEELQRVVTLVASGKLRPIVTREASLEDVNELIQLLKEGKIVSRAVIKPS